MLILSWRRKAALSSCYHPCDQGLLLPLPELTAVRLLSYHLTSRSSSQAPPSTQDPQTDKQGGPEAVWGCPHMPAR